jgi:glucose/arabinose dehydrogenase
MKTRVACSAALVAVALIGVGSAQQQAPPAGPVEGGRGRGGFPPPIGVPPVPLGDGPFVLDTAEQHKVRVVVVTKGLSHPWSVAFLPDGSMLVTERAARLRIIRNGVLDQTPVAGLPQIHARGLAGLMDVVLHPRFVENKLLYLAYSKPGEKGATTAVARARWDGTALAEVKDVFVGDAWVTGTGPSDGSFGSRIAFGRDGMMYVTLGDRNVPHGGQNPGDHLGKIVRLRDDGTVPPDNPFVGKAGYKPEIYTLGHRNQQGLAVHPETGALWETEQGPNGGDEINIIEAGRNYGWPLVSFGRTYQGPRQSEIPWKEGMEQPLIFWVPSIATSGMTFYTGDRFPRWKGNVFVGALREGEIPGTGHLERIVFNQQGDELRRESLLTELKQRIRDVRQGPDGMLYVLTEEDNGALLRMEPTE